MVIAKGGRDAYMVGKIAVSQLRRLMTAYKAKLDKDNFLQNLILDNLLLVDIYNRAKETAHSCGREAGCAAGGDSV